MTVDLIFSNTPCKQVKCGCIQLFRAFVCFCNSASHYNLPRPVPQKSDLIWPCQIWEHLQGQTFQLLRRDHLEIPGDAGSARRLAIDHGITKSYGRGKRGDVCDGDTVNEVVDQKPGDVWGCWVMVDRSPCNSHLCLVGCRQGVASGSGCLFSSCVCPAPSALDVSRSCVASSEKLSVCLQPQSAFAWRWSCRQEGHPSRLTDASQGAFGSPV